MTAASAMTEPQPVRPLAEHERDALIALIEHGTESIDGRVIDARRRAGWLAQVPVTFAGLRCECGTCPSIDLVDAEGRTPDGETSRIVLEAATDDAILLLFIDDDRLSYLELAPISPEQSFMSFPPASVILA